LTESNTGRVTIARLEERVNGIETRVNVLEKREKAHQDNYTNILVKLEVLTTKVGFLAAGIGTVTGVGTSIAMSLLKGAL
jgi:hypothetical protein